MFIGVMAAVAGVSLLIAVSAVGLLFLLSYFRMPAGSHKDAGEGALTVAMLIAQNDKSAEWAKGQEKMASVRLFSVNVLSGYADTTPTGTHHAAELSGPADWTPPSSTEQTGRILAVPVDGQARSLVSAA